MHHQKTPPDSSSESDDMEMCELDAEDVEFVSDNDEVIDQSDEELDEDEPINDDSKMVLGGHTKSVFCVAVDPFGRYIASGGQDHVSIVWDARSGEEVFRSAGHEDSVIAVAFSPNGAFLATGDMLGELFVWKAPDSSAEASWSLHGAFSCAELVWLRWWSGPATRNAGPSQVLVAGSEEGVVSLNLITPTGSQEKRSKCLLGLGTGAVSGEFIPSTCLTNSPQLAVLYSCGAFRVWDLKSARTTVTASLSTVPASGTDTVSAYTCMAAPNPLAVSGFGATPKDVIAVGGSGRLFVFACKPPLDESTKRIPDSSISRVDIQSTETVEAINFSWTHSFFAFGTLDGVVGIYDTDRMRIRQQWIYSENSADASSGIGITQLEWSRSEAIFFTSTLDGAIVAWPGICNSSRKPAQLAVWRGHRGCVLDMKLFPLQRVSDEAATGKTKTVLMRHPYVVSAGDDTTLRIFNLMEQ